MQNKNKESSHPTAREIAYLALAAAKSGSRFIEDILDEWIAAANPSTRDAALAREIACGSCRMSLALDALAVGLASKGKLSLKLKERLLLHTALYQYFYLDRIPLYAINNETLGIAHKYTHPRFVKFLNAMLRKLEGASCQLPSGSGVADISVRLSYPAFFVERMLCAYGLEKTIQILEAGNHSSPVMFRVRSSEGLSHLAPGAYHLLPDSPETMAALDDTACLSSIAASPDFYIQNATPVALMAFLRYDTPSPLRILDLCASPGGKLLLAHDFFPTAALFANDVNLGKIERLRANLLKYGLKAALSCGPGEQFQSAERFDLIILDVPCSNTGVLNKRPEARWRLSEEHLAATIKLQQELLHHAAGLLSQKGEIWYLTCSILPEENEALLEKMVAGLGLRIRCKKTILPDVGGADGGFACAFVRA